jgi:hypothetical protein
MDIEPDGAGVQVWHLDFEGADLELLAVGEEFVGVPALGPPCSFGGH